MSIETIIVNFNAGKTLRQCVDALVNDAEAGSITVVDNASSDGSAQDLCERYGAGGKVKFIFNRDNLGFARAVNAVARHSDADWVLILNPDCILEPGALGQMKVALEQDSAAGLAGPSVRDAEGQTQAASMREFPSPKKSLMTFSGLWRLGKRFPAFKGVNAEITGLNDTALRCDAVSGACMLLRRKALEEVGYMDEGYAMHCEDLDLMYRLSLHGWHCLYVPAAGCLHRQGLSSRSRPGWVHFQKHRGMARFFRKFQSGETLLPLRLLVYTGIWIRFVLLWPLALIRR